MDIKDRWESITEDEYCEFHKVQNKRSQRADMHAFLLLDELFPGTGDMVCHTEHDEIWLDVEDEQVETLTDEQMIELARCGVRYSGDGGLCMFA